MKGLIHKQWNPPLLKLIQWGVAAGLFCLVQPVAYGD